MGDVMEKSVLMSLERITLVLLLAGLGVVLGGGCGQSTEDSPSGDETDAGADVAIDADSTTEASTDSGQPGCPERAPMLMNTDACPTGMFCEYDETVPSDNLCRTTVAFCPSAGRPWQQRLYQRCSTTPSKGEGSWSGILILLFVETGGTCGPLGHYNYNVDENRFDEYLCEAVSRGATGTDVAETLQCQHQSLEAILDASLTMTWTGKFWEGTAEVSLFSESLQVDCMSTYAVRAEAP